MTYPILATGFLSMLPLIELRFAIPWGFFSWHLSIFEATIASFIGNFLSVGIVLWLWPKIAKLIEKHSPAFHIFLQKIFAHTRTKHSHKFKTWGSAFLIFFVMVPIPGSGGWSGSLIAWLFGVKYWHAMILLFWGLLLAAIVVGGMTIGIDGSFKIVTEFFSLVAP